MLAKLGSGCNKPNKQTVVRNRAVQKFLSDFKFTKIRNLGGKLGDEVTAMFNTDSVKELLEVPLDQLKRLGDDTGSWLYDVIRGVDNSEVNLRTQIKSMLSAKSFRPCINSFDQATKWLRIFAADIFSRCVEEGVLENKRRPKTINLHHRSAGRTSGQQRSKSSPIPQGKPLSEETLFKLAADLMAQVVTDGRAWPCSNLSLSVGGFEDGVSNNKGIGGFLVRGDEAKAVMAGERERAEHVLDGDERPAEKRRKLDGGRIQKFFVPRDDSRPESDHDQDLDFDHDEAVQADNQGLHIEEVQEQSTNGGGDRYLADLPPSAQGVSTAAPPLRQESIETYFCSRYNAQVPIERQPEHEDYHYAKDLAKELQQEERASAPRPQSSTPKPQQPKGRGRPPGAVNVMSKGMEKGQKKLAFGKG
ncbi:hypothetical protein LTS18_009926 [Coniosporium uncinatum]|uniref:Uncharacterized protein n=1 Tax=Coniosporium uncinatum TaxID=93489 RepID=A0ACC3DWF1_9PEZI|nr:hypothetical protein LTS18_009926 [Coniosporium uncinatum]